MADGVEAGRAHFDAMRWRAAYDCLSQSATEPEDLERLAVAAYLLGWLPDYFAALERAYAGFAAAGRTLDAARCARWLGLVRMRSGDVGQGSGWIARAARLVEEYGAGCADLGYLRIPEMFMHEAEGRLEAALQVARAVEAIGRTYADLELIALAVTSQGQQLISLGRVREGLARLDEAMVSATTGELSPIVNGIVYCSVIVGCRAAYEPRRAAEWTDALKQWCDAQPDMQIFAGECRVHRAEILELHGAWDEALTELGPITTSGSDPFSTGNAWYVSAEVARLQGRYADAETNYRKAAEFGRDPQPGLALLRAVRGSTQAAATMIRTALASGSANPERPTILRAAVEILIAVDELDEARAAAQELAELADHFGSRLLAAFAQDASGRIARVGGDAATALAQLRAAAAEWQRLAAPYDLARIRTLIGKTLHELGDEESADVELAAARAVFERLGALADLAALDQLRPAAGEKAAGLTAREVEVLRLVAGGATNRAIAEQLVLSERTVDRHVSNIFAKLGVSSRTAAAAYAFERQLV